MRPFADAIWKWAGTYGVDKVVAASLFWRESFAAAKAQGKDPATITSPAGAVGIGQIMPLHVGEKTPWGHTITSSDLSNPQFNIRWSMYFFSQQEAKYGSPDAAYAKGYNPGYTGPALTSLLPKGYVPRSGLSPTDKGTVTAETTAAADAAKAQVFDKWATIDKQGHIKFVNIADPTQPPKNALTYGGSPLTQSSFNQVWKQTYSDTFAAYTGRAATGTEIKQILQNAPSTYALANQLANGKDFQKSPVWKQHAPGLVEFARGILGENWKPSGGIIRKAIAQNWDQATFQAHIRQLPAYTKGPEFQTNLAHNQAAFEQIYGRADPHVMALLKDKTLAGWTPDELQSWLRSQPGYVHTTEYQAKSTSFLSAMGLITGAVPTLTGDQVDQALTAGDQLPGATQVKPPAKPFQPTPTDFISEHGQGGGYR